MANRKCIPQGFQQKARVCVLASYSFILGYYKNLRDGNVNNENSVKFDELGDIYLRYILKLIKDSTKHIEFINYFKKQNNLFKKCKININIDLVYESFIFYVFHHYCQNIADIRGYEHIKQFDEYLKDHRSSLKIYHNLIECKTDISDSSKAVEKITEHLDKDENNIAMLLYVIPENGAHSVMVAKDQNNQIIYRDPNSEEILKDKTIDGFQFNESSEIYEYILFSPNNVRL